MSRQVTLRLPERLQRSLDRHARRTGKPRSVLVREAIELYLNGTAAGGMGTPYERVRDLIGSVRGAWPADLATRHKEYLRRLFRGRR